VGTYVHGPLLPKNPWLADWLIGRALARRHGPVALEPLDDALEHAASAAAAAVARRR
jgi:CobQ-like glutamine amidotransferase family enzyme